MGTEHLALLRRFYSYDSGIPSHDTLCDVFAALDPELFKFCFLAWINGLRDDDPDIIAVDGKTSRRSHDRRKGRNPLHLVSAWAVRQRIVLGQQATEEKSNATNSRQAGEFLSAEAVGAGGDDEFAKLGHLTCLEVSRPRPLSRWLGGTPGPSMVITTRSGSCASCRVALAPYLIALSTRLLIARRRAVIGRQLIATPRALE